MGGPATPAETGGFLQRLFADKEIIDLGVLQSLGPLIAKRRTPKIEKQYETIGGSPIRHWTQVQGKAMTTLLDQLHPETAPHKHYIAFRYAHPLTDEALLQMRDDGVTRAIAFSQYPQYSCTTAGSSLNNLWRELERLDMTHKFRWSVIDRWHTNKLFIQAVAKRIELGLQQFDLTDGTPREHVVIVFSAHSIPMRIVNRGDHYPQEVAATVQAVMQQVNATLAPEEQHKYLLAWQSKVGPLPWLGPKTGEVIKGLAQQGHKNVLVVPIAFTSDHVETLYEIDVEYKKEAEKLGIKRFIRAPSLNDEPLIFEAFANIVAEHLSSGEVSTPQYQFNCAQCVNPLCRSIVNPIKPFSNLRERVKAFTDARQLDAEPTSSAKAPAPH